MNPFDGDEGDDDGDDVTVVPDYDESEDEDEESEMLANHPYDFLLNYSKLVTDGNVDAAEEMRLFVVLTRASLVLGGNLTAEAENVGKIYTLMTRMT